MSMTQAWQLIRAAINAWAEDLAPSMGAALSYYMLFSIAPLLIIVMAVAGFFFGADAVRGEVFGQLSGLMGAQGAGAIEALLKSASRPREGAIATAAGIVVLVIGATTALAELQSDLDRIWRAPVEHSVGGLWKFIRARLLSFAMILTLAFLLMVSLVFGAALSALGKWWGSWFFGWEVLAHVVDLALSFGLTMLLFAMIYKIVPRAHIRWHDVWIGAAVTALQAPDRAISRQERRQLGVRRGRLIGARHAVGLLLGADFSDRRRIHVGIRTRTRIATRRRAQTARASPR